MLQPPLPSCEPQRLRALDRLGLVHTPAEERFDRITRMAARTLGVPIALVSLVGRDHQWFKSRVGLMADATPRDVSFCGHAILGDEALVVPDALLDSRFADNPLVLGAPNIRFYAGHPVRDQDGFAVGSLCLIDMAPREFGDEDREVLRDLASLVEGELRLAALGHSQRALVDALEESRRRSLVDPLSQCWNRAGMDAVAARASSSGSACGVILVDIDHFKHVNDTHGHAAGDAVIAGVASRLRQVVRSCDAVGRMGGEEFMVLAEGCPKENLLGLAERIRAAIAATPVETPAGPVSITASVGCHWRGSGMPSDAASAMAMADGLLYEAKRGGRNRVCASSA